MNYIESLILGVLQGVTEFLPISSSGHLVIVQHFLGVVNEGLLFEVILHLGTLISILIYYYQDLQKIIINYFKGNYDTKNYVNGIQVGKWRSLDSDGKLLFSGL